MSAPIDHYDPPIQGQRFGQDLDHSVSCVCGTEDEDGFERSRDGHCWVRLGSVFGYSWVVLVFGYVNGV